jgi:hypothetical protein
VSRQAYIGVLAHHEPRDARATSFIPADQADTLVASMVAEQISRAKIRMFAPTSVFMTIARDRDVMTEVFGPRRGTAPQTSIAVRYLCGAEIPGVRFEPPADQKHRYQRRAAEVFREWQHWKNQLDGVADSPATAANVTV